MLVLAIESTTEKCSVAVSQNSMILASHVDTTVHRQDEILLPMIVNILEEVGETLKNVDLFAVTVGPGTFTGVRVGLSIAKSLSLATGCPLTGVTTTETIAWGMQNYNSSVILVLLDIHRSDICTQPFLLTGVCPIPLCPARTLAPTSISDFLSSFPVPYIVAGNYTRSSVHLEQELHPHARTVAEIAVARGCILPALTIVEPLYLPI